MRKFIFFAFAILLTICVADALVVAQNKKSKTPPRRARLPEFKRNEVPKPFFKDLFKEALVGTRPSNLGTAPVAPSGGNPSNGGGTDTSGFAWSKIISSTTIEDEIKALKSSVDKNISTPSDFAGRGHKFAKRDFSLAAVMFAIAGEYDAQVRWKKDAPSVRDAFARTASNTKAGGNIQVYQQAKMRKADLQDLIGGGSFQAAKQGERKVDWEKVCNRSPLMQRLEKAHQKNMQPWTANKDAFQSNKEQLLHEAEIVAALATILTKEGMEEYDDEDYAVFCVNMKKAALKIVDGVKLDQYDQARLAVGQIGKACSECHDIYR